MPRLIRSTWGTSSGKDAPIPSRRGIMWRFDPPYISRWRSLATVPPPVVLTRTDTKQDYRHRLFVKPLPVRPPPSMKRLETVQPIRSSASWQCLLKSVRSLTWKLRQTRHAGLRWTQWLPPLQRWQSDHTTCHHPNTDRPLQWLAIKLNLSVNGGVGGGDSSVVRAPDSWLKGRGFESLLERRENFLLQGRLSVLTLISGSTPVLPQ